MPDKLYEAFGKVASAWNDAEAAIKLAEQVSEDVINPAIYELRYAGRKMVEAHQIQEKDSGKAAELLQDAYMDCCRSRHDAIDALSSKVVSDLDLSVEKLGSEVVLAQFADWGILYEKLNEIRAKIAQSRQDRIARNDIYEDIQNGDLNSVIQLHQRFKIAEPLMEKSAKKSRFGHVIGYMLGIVGICIGLYSCASQ